LVIAGACPSIQTTARQITAVPSSFKAALWALYTRGATSVACNRPVDMSRAFAGVPIIECLTIPHDTGSRHFRPEDVETVRLYNLDFILQITPGIICGDIVQASTYGLWSFHHGDETKVRDDAPAFWEVYRGESTTIATLQRRGDNPAESVVLQKCVIRTRQFSYRQNLNAIMWAMTYMPARVCRDILMDCARSVEAPPHRSQAPISRHPSNLEMIVFFCRIAASWLSHQFASILFLDNWNVGVVQEPIHRFLQRDFRPQVEWLSHRQSDGFIADPFVLRIGSKLVLMVEEFDRHARRGSIAQAELSSDGALRPLFKKAMETDIHMSYPCLFEHQGLYYCVPESSQARSVFLYRLNAEQTIWSLAATIIRDFAAADPTIVEHEGRWWLFCTSVDDGPDTNLFVWHAPVLEGPWKQHPGNPVKVDVRSSRPAGRPFVFEGKLYRPAQDCSLTYGGAITINRVTCLTTREFSEEPAARIQPIEPYRKGIHTAVGYGSITVVDGKRLTFAPVRALRRKLRNTLLRGEGMG